MLIDKYILINISNCIAPRYLYQFKNSYLLKTLITGTIVAEVDFFKLSFN